MDGDWEFIGHVHKIRISFFSLRKWETLVPEPRLRRRAFRRENTNVAFYPGVITVLAST